MFGIGSNRPPVPQRFQATRWWTAATVFVLLLVVFGAIGWYWSREPDLYLVAGDSEPAPAVTGYRTVDTLIRTIDWLLDKPGGYLTNDVTPPSLWLDNMPSFEYGVVVQSRDLARVLRNDFGRSQSISAEDIDLTNADPALNFSNDSWIFPPTESRYREAADALRAYRARLVDANSTDGQFFARADNLREWLAIVERRLGSMSQRLSASVGRTRINTDLAGDPAGEESRSQGRFLEIKTPWLDIDDVFYEGRGTAWALLQFMAAVEDDFRSVLEDKNAVVSVEQIMRELEGALEPVASPMILNGEGYGFFANHSLVLANYLSRAHAAVIDLRELLAQG
jgi:hypothetical protein